MCITPYKQNGKVPVQLKISLGRQKDNQPDIGAYGFAGLFSEYCNQLSTESVGNNFKRDFGVPIYDGYEEAIPKEPIIEPRSANGENQATIQIQKVETGEDGECARGDSLPLCYSSFELIRHMIKASK